MIFPSSVFLIPNRLFEIPFSTEKVTNSLGQTRKELEPRKVNPTVFINKFKFLEQNLN